MASFAVLVCMCVAAVSFDLTKSKIPNLLNGIGFVAGVVISLAGQGIRGLTDSLAGSLLGLCFLLVPFFLHMVGGGDVKFLGAAGAVVGWRCIWLSFLAGAAIGGVIALVVLFARSRSLISICRRTVALFTGMWRLDTAGTTDALHGDARMPYSLPLSLGLIAVTAVRLFT